MIPRKPFYFLRHGETNYNVNPFLFRKDVDLFLNKHGIEQAEEVRAHIEGLPIQAIYHSPLARAKQTTEIISSNLSHQKIEVEDLRECLTTVWISMLRTDSRNAPLCQGTQTFFDQVISGLNQTLERDELPLIVAHGGVHFALCHLLSIEDHPKSIGNCTLVFFNPTGATSWTAEIVFPS